MSQARLTQLVFEALDELNRARRADKALPRSLDARLVGPGAGLDSLELMTFMSLVEGALAAAFAIELVLSDVEGAFDEAGPFSSASALVDYLERAIAPADKASLGG